MAEPSLEYLTVREVAAHYRTTEGTVRWWRHTKFGPQAVKLGAKLLYPRSEIERYDRELAGQARDAAAS